jgi:arylsulfatase A-like enzyme
LTAPAALRRLALALLLAGSASGCAREARPPNLVLISIDTLRPDHLGLYGYRRPTSPALDAFARQAVVFERAYSTSNWTLPAHVSMLTGLYPAEHGVLRLDQAIGRGVELLPEALGGLGYRSAAVVSTVPFLTARHGFARGWQVYDDRTAYPAAGAEPRRFVSSALVHRRALELLDELAGSPFFLFLHYFDVHAPYRPPAPYDSMFPPAPPAQRAAGSELELRAARAMSRYDGEIRHVDAWLERLFAELDRRGLADSTLVAVTADHGEEFLEHGRRYHRKNLFDATLRVPMIVRFPGGAHAGRRVATPVSLVDLGATLLAAAGSGRDTWASGRDLAGLAAGGADPAWRDRPLLATGDARDGLLVALIAGGAKIVGPAGSDGRPAAGRWLVTELGAEGRERPARPLDRAEAERQLARLTAAWAERRAAAAGATATAASTPGVEETAALRALGYL